MKTYRDRRDDGRHPHRDVATHARSVAERIEPYQARFGRMRPLIAVVGENDGNERTDFVTMRAGG